MASSSNPIHGKQLQGVVRFRICFAGRDLFSSSCRSLAKYHVGQIDALRSSALTPACSTLPVGRTEARSRWSRRGSSAAREAIVGARNWSETAWPPCAARARRERAPRGRRGDVGCYDIRQGRVLQELSQEIFEVSNQLAQCATGDLSSGVAALSFRTRM